MIHDDILQLILVCLVLLAIFIGTWIGLTKVRRARFYKWAWFPAVFLLTGAGVLLLANAIYLEAFGHGWDYLSAAILFVLSAPLIILDVIFLLRWPQK